jgi:hypothetical protein
MVLPILVAGAGALAAGAAAAQVRRQLAKMAAGPRGDALRAGMLFREGEQELNRHVNVMVVTKGTASGQDVRSLFDFVLVTDQRVRFLNAHREDEEFHESEDEFSLELSSLAGVDLKGGIADELEAFVFVHGFRVVLLVCPDWTRDFDFSTELSFGSRTDRASFLRSAHVARSHCHNGADVEISQWSTSRGGGGTLVSDLDQACLDEMEIPLEPEPCPEPEPEIFDTVAVGCVLCVMESATVRSQATLHSPQVGMLFEDELIRVLDLVTLDGRQRVRFGGGWASVSASDGSLLLEVMAGGTTMSDAEGRPSNLQNTLTKTGQGDEATELGNPAVMAHQMRESRLQSLVGDNGEVRGPPFAAAELIDTNTVAELRLSGGGSPGGNPACSAGSEFSAPGLIAVPQLDRASKLLASNGSQSQTAALATVWRALPNVVQVYDWCLQYRLTEHGSSLSSLLRHAGDVAPVLIIVRVDRPAEEVQQGEPHQFIVGALASRPLADASATGGGHNAGSGKWKGTGQSFIFGMPLRPLSEGTHGELAVPFGSMQCYCWTRECSCFQMCGAKEGLGFGGGGSGYGLHINSTTQLATSASCTTYGNPSSLLAPPTKCHPGTLTGTVLEIEVWSFNE